MSTKFIAIAVIAAVSTPTFNTALKLTPVQPSTQRIDLANESKNTAIALTEALLRIEKGDLPLSDAALLIEVPEIQRLFAVVRRWMNMEDKLKTIILPGSLQQKQLFEDIIHNVASIRALVGHLLFRAGDEGLSLQELEQSCPILWQYKSSWRSLESDGWLDCYASTGDLYIRSNRFGEAARVEASLLDSIPWIQSMYKHPTSVTNNDTKEKEPLENLRDFMNLSAEDRKKLGLEMKNAWALAEGIRGSFKVLVDEFIQADSARARISIYLRAQKVTDEILQQYLSEKSSKSNVPTDDSSATTTPSSAVSSLESSSIDLSVVRGHLHEEIKVESQLFLRIMNEVVEHGDDYILSTLTKQHANHLSQPTATLYKTSFQALQAEFSDENLQSSASPSSPSLSDGEDFVYKHPIDILEIFHVALVKKHEALLLQEAEKEMAAKISGEGRNQQKRSTRRDKSPDSSKASNHHKRGTTSDAHSKRNGNTKKQSQHQPTKENTARSWSQFIIEKLQTMLLAAITALFTSLVGGYYLKTQQHYQHHQHQHHHHHPNGLHKQKQSQQVSLRFFNPQSSYGNQNTSSRTSTPMERQAASTLNSANKSNKQHSVVPDRFQHHANVVNQYIVFAGECIELFTVEVVRVRLKRMKVFITSMTVKIRSQTLSLLERLKTMTDGNKHNNSNNHSLNSHQKDKAKRSNGKSVSATGTESLINDLTACSTQQQTRRRKKSISSPATAPVLAPATIAVRKNKQETSCVLAASSSEDTVVDPITYHITKEILTLSIDTVCNGNGRRSHSAYEDGNDHDGIQDDSNGDDGPRTQDMDPSRCSPNGDELGDSTESPTYLQIKASSSLVRQTRRKEAGNSGLVISTDGGDDDKCRSVNSSADSEDSDAAGDEQHKDYDFRSFDLLYDLDEFANNPMKQEEGEWIEASAVAQRRQRHSKKEQKWKQGAGTQQHQYTKTSHHSQNSISSQQQQNYHHSQHKEHCHSEVSRTSSFRVHSSPVSKDRALTSPFHSSTASNKGISASTKSYPSISTANAVGVPSGSSGSVSTKPVYSAVLTKNLPDHGGNGSGQAQPAQQTHSVKSAAPTFPSFHRQQQPPYHIPVISSNSTSTTTQPDDHDHDPEEEEDIPEALINGNDSSHHNLHSLEHSQAGGYHALAETSLVGTHAKVAAPSPSAVAQFYAMFQLSRAQHLQQQLPPVADQPKHVRPQMKQALPVLRSTSRDEDRMMRYDNNDHQQQQMGMYHGTPKTEAPTDSRVMYSPHHANAHVTDQNIIESNSGDAVGMMPMMLPFPLPPPPPPLFTTSPHHFGIRSHSQDPMLPHMIYFPPPLLPSSLPTSMPPPPPPPLAPPPLSATALVRHQIEYYFSDENLEKDLYLRSLMDREGFVLLSEIAKFRRIACLRLPIEAIEESLLWGSESLEVVVEEEDAADVPDGHERQNERDDHSSFSEMKAGNRRRVVSKVRSRYGYHRWITPTSVHV